MLWFALAHLAAFLVDLGVGVRRRDRDKDLQILAPRHQVRLLQRQRPRPPRLTRGEKLTLAVVRLYPDGWNVASIADYLATRRDRAYAAVRRWFAEGLPGLEDQSRAPQHPTRKVDLKALVAIRRLQANPELGGFRVSAALEQQQIFLSPRTLALQRDGGGGAPGRGGAARTPAPPLRGDPPPPDLVGRHPLHRGPRARHRQARLRHRRAGG